VDEIKRSEILTVEPLGVVFERSSETELSPARRHVKEIRPEDDGVSLGELCVGARVQPRKVGGVATRHPQGGGVVSRVVGALGSPQPNARHVLVTPEVGQVALQTYQHR